MKKVLDLRLYLVLDPVLCGGLQGVVDTAVTAVRHGVTTVQLRATKPWKKRQCYLAAMALKQALQDTPVPLIINDHVDVAVAAQADGVHVGQNDLPIAQVCELMGSARFVGLSITRASELASVPWDGVDYLGIGPVFPTGTKADAAADLGLAQLAEIQAASQCPAVAIGGIHAGNAAAVMACGVAGVAVVSAICGQTDVAGATDRLCQALKGAQ